MFSGEPKASNFLRMGDPIRRKYLRLFFGFRL